LITILQEEALTKIGPDGELPQ